MSYRCNNCLYIFQNKLSNCPFCGSRIFENEVSDLELITDGFVHAPIPASYDKNVNITNSIVDNHTDKTSNIFEELQASYNREYISDNLQENASNSNKMPSKDYNSSLKANSSISSSTEGGFFAQFSADSEPSAPEVEISSIPPTISPTSSNPTSTYHDEDTTYDREMQRLEAQQRRLQRDYTRLAISNFFRNIRWRNVFRFITIVGTVVIAIVIWNMRYIIIESITNFLISLIPIIIIAILWYLIKSFFK